MAPGRTHQDAVLGHPERYFDPTAFVLQPAGTLGNLGRGALIGPNLRTFDLALVKNVRWSRLGENGRVQFRTEFFNLFNRVNLGTPSLVAFSGSFGFIGGERPTVTEPRQIQLGLRISF